MYERLACLIKTDVCGMSVEGTRTSDMSQFESFSDQVNLYISMASNSAFGGMNYEYEV